MKTSIMTEMERLANDPTVRAALAKIPRVAEVHIQHPAQPRARKSAQPEPEPRPTAKPYPAVREGKLVSYDFDAENAKAKEVFAQKQLVGKALVRLSYLENHVAAIARKIASIRRTLEASE